MSRIRWLVLTALTVLVIGAISGVLIASNGGPFAGDSGPQRYEANGTILESPQHGPELCLGGLALSLPPQCEGIPLVAWDWEAVEGEESERGTTWKAVRVEGTYDGSRFTVQDTSEYENVQISEESRFEPACDEPEAVDPDAGNAEWEEATQVEGGAFSNAPGLAAAWVSDPSGPDYDGPFVGNLVVRPGFAGQATEYARRYFSGYLCVVERDQRLAKELEADFERLNDVLTQVVLMGSVNYQRGVIEATITVVDDQATREVEEAFGERVVELSGALKPI